jgi:hypothetical protein
MSKFGEELIESLTDALAHARGEASGVREHKATKAPSSRKPRARRAAEKASPDPNLLTVSPQAHMAFLARLAKSPKPNDRLRRTMRTVPPWK